MKQRTKEKSEVQKTVAVQAQKMEATGSSKELIQENVQINLSDFALFLSVMKVKEAYEDVLSIILDEPDFGFGQDCQRDKAIGRMGGGRDDYL